MSAGSTMYINGRPLPSIVHLSAIPRVLNGTMPIALSPISLSIPFFSGDDGRGKRLFVARYEASEDVIISILFLVFCSRTARFIAMPLVRKNPDMSPITEIPIAISRSSEPFCLLCFLLQWLLMLFLP